MEKESYHTHTTISDGKLSPRELIEFAIKKGFKTLAITDHYSRPPKVDASGWSSGFYTESHYLQLKKLKKEYKDKICILIGAEFEWYSSKKGWLFAEVDKRDYDIKIISVHQIPVNGKYYPINYSEETFDEVLDLLGGDIKKLVVIYYNALREAINSKKFDIVGHFDVIKSLNGNSKYFSEKAGWYREEVIRTLNVLGESGMKMEIHLQGFLRACKEQWPSKWIIEEARKRGIRFVVGTDAHGRFDLDYNCEEIEKIIGENV